MRAGCRPSAANDSKRCSNHASQPSEASRELKCVDNAELLGKDGRTYRSARRGALEGAPGGGRRPGDRGHDKLSHMAMPPFFDAQILSRPSPPWGEGWVGASNF